MKKILKVCTCLQLLTMTSFTEHAKQLLQDDDDSDLGTRLGGMIDRMSILAVFGMCCVLVTVAEGIGFYGYYINTSHDDTVTWTSPWFLAYYIPKTMNITLSCIIWATSVYVQRKNLQISKVYDGTMQSHLTNVILLFMAGMYFATMTTMGFYDEDLAFRCSFNFFYAVGLLFVAAHLLGNLKWGTITTKHYDMDSANWWCCIVCTYVSFAVDELSYVCVCATIVYYFWNVSIYHSDGGHAMAG